MKEYIFYKKYNKEKKRMLTKKELGFAVAVTVFIIFILILTISSLSKENFPSSQAMNMLYSDASGNLSSTSDVTLQNLKTGGLTIEKNVGSNNDYGLMLHYQNDKPQYYDWAIGPYVKDNEARFAIRGGGDGNNQRNLVEVSASGDISTSGTLNAGNTTLGTLNAGRTTVGTLNAGNTTINGTLNAGNTTLGTLNAGTTTTGALNASSITTDGDLSAGSVSSRSYSSAIDLREGIKPNSLGSKKVQFGFGTIGNGSGSYSDYIHLNGWSDSTGGKQNLVMFNKGDIGMRVFQGEYGSDNKFSTYKDAVMKDSSGDVGDIRNMTISGNMKVNGTASYTNGLRKDATSWNGLTCPDGKVMVGLEFSHPAHENWSYQESFRLICK